MIKNNIVSREFSFEDISNFADLSGDWNPFHINKILARRLIAGNVVCHGVCSLLWTLEEVLKEIPEIPRKISCNFINPVSAEQKVTIKIENYNESLIRVSVRSDSGTNLFMEIFFGGKINQKEYNDSDFEVSSPLVYNFEDLKDLSGNLRVSGSSSLFMKNWPSLVNRIGIAPVASIINISRLVGMYCPGQNSIFSSLSIGLNENYISNDINWSVERHTIRIAPIKIKVIGLGIKGSLEAFYRPPPISQESIDLISKKVSSTKFYGKTALIIGASRGLGETTAKIISASGGNVILTYDKGKNDAMRVMSEINSSKRKCSMINLDVLDSEKMKETLNPLVEKVDSLFYFASPKIKSSISENIDLALVDLYRKFYVAAFRIIINIFLSNTKKKFLFFYPSTVFIDQKDKKFREYIIAKTEGEELCNSINKMNNNLDIYLPRLPQMLTDQNSGVMGLKTEDTTEILTRCIGRMAL